MNYKFLSLITALLLGCGWATAQDYEDDIYYDGKSEVTTTRPVKVVTKRQPQGEYYGQLSTTVSPISGIVNGRDVDEYNRHTDGYYLEDDTVYIDKESFSNTRRIERFHNPDIVIRSNDPDLIEYYFDNTPTVNIIVGSDWSWGPYCGWGYRYYDPWYSWHWGWSSPWYYSSWYDWGWYGGYRYHPWSYWGRPWGWGGYYGWSHHWGWSRPWGGWYGDRGRRYNSGYNGRRPGLNYHGNRGNSVNRGYAGAPGRINGGRSSIASRGGRGMNHGNINSVRDNGYYGGRSTMQPGRRSSGGGIAGSRPSSTYNSGGVSRGRSYGSPSGTRSYSSPSSSGRSYSGGSRSSFGGSSFGGGRSSGGFSGGSHGGGGGFSGGGHGGGSHGGGGHGGRR